MRRQSPVSDRLVLRRVAEGRPGFLIRDFEVVAGKATRAMRHERRGGRRRDEEIATKEKKPAGLKSRDGSREEKGANRFDTCARIGANRTCSSVFSSPGPEVLANQNRAKGVALLRRSLLPARPSTFISSCGSAVEEQPPVEARGREVGHPFHALPRRAIKNGAAGAWS